MDENKMDTDNKKEKNIFFTRGCRHVPRPYLRNEKLYCNGCSKLDSFDWLKKINAPESQLPNKIVEIRFKNSRKDFFREPADVKLLVGEIVAVEASPGHDLGIVTMQSGLLVELQMRKKGISPDSQDIKKVYRRARSTDIEKWISAVELESHALKRTKAITSDLRIEMKLNDVESQADGTKAIFYYTAEERVDFRELIKILAEEFKVRIEMKQIGVRQEASRLGGIGICGRETCCSSWMSNFKSVSTSSARTQQLSLNPQKLAGQCGKLKCCLNYEQDVYVDALKDFPDSSIVLITKKKKAVHQKTDIFKKVMWYSYTDDDSNLMALPLAKVLGVIEMNSRGVFPEKLEDLAIVKEKKIEFENVIGQDDLTRFDE